MAEATRVDVHCPRCGETVSVAVQTLGVERDRHPVSDEPVLNVTFEGMYVKHACNMPTVR